MHIYDQQFERVQPVISWKWSRARIQGRELLTRVQFNVEDRNVTLVLCNSEMPTIYVLMSTMILNGIFRRAAAQIKRLVGLVLLLLKEI